MPFRTAHAEVRESLLHQPQPDSGDPTHAAVAATADEELDAPPHSREARVPHITERLQNAFASEATHRFVLRDNGAIENLPSIKAPELQLIGRCVSFGMKQTTNGVDTLYYFTGVVSAVTATAVTLMYVNRYTEADFKTYREREKKWSTGSTARHSHEFPEGDCTACMLILTNTELVPTDRSTSEREADISRFSYSLSEVLEGAFRKQSPSLADSHGSISPAVKMITGDALQSLSVHTCQGGATKQDNQVEPTVAHTALRERARTFRTCGDSLGPLPYATFLRKNLHDVAFGRSPDSSFYSLFQDPSKKLMDMQYLRIFVRRYLVHTSQGNNPEQMLLHTFLKERSGWSVVDHDLVCHLVREEVVELLRHDRAIAKEKKRLRNREERREATVRSYRAPSGLFADTGFLYLTGLPQGTMLTGVTLFFFTCVFALSYVLPVIVTGDGLTRSFFTEIDDKFLASLLMWTVTSVGMFFHAVVLRLPSCTNAPVLVLRGLTSVGSAVYAILCVMLITHGFTNDYLYHCMRETSPTNLCAFYERNQCSGFYTGCQEKSRNDPLCAPCMPVSYPDLPCNDIIVAQLQRVLLPLFLFSIIIFFCAVFSLFLLFKLLLMVRTASVASLI